MICQECNQRPATLHFTKIINGEKTEVHLCEKCAQEKGEMFMFSGESGFTFNNLLAGLLNIDTSFKQKNKNTFQREEILQCDRCGMTFPQFVKIGRIGCSHCYDTFKDELKPVLKRLHSGNWTHNGKIPKRSGGGIQLRKRIEDLKSELKNSIIQEEFEKAAYLRDEIRSLEQDLTENQEGGK
ncbi:UvrB/UvrC motif-containing protein [Neobacillus sp. PS3-12]|jgi:protein arginine kinase activator|uniref:UvrB/UvrC motif-containing protein n=1 Tax=Neobacillus sp. PS3-12 TaxID=3070677 RepID=UPI0027DF44D1|nr:UvrB/UvrC motif-containing protein [Neobacillus sp. PS3-12]WML55514.1 UvrB/UvrC motif-containing protein [Neobacillus sp. PS3-12]